MGVVYSTKPDFHYDTGGDSDEETLPNEKQTLRITLDKRNRSGKTVTLVTGFRGKADDLAVLGKSLKVKCGAGGTAKDGEIIIQGDFCQKVTELLARDGYKIR